MEIIKSDKNCSEINLLHMYYQLSNNMELVEFLFFIKNLDAIKCNLMALLLCSLEGEKEHYNDIKKIIQNQIKEIFDVMDKFVLEQYENKIKTNTKIN